METMSFIRVMAAQGVKMFNTAMGSPHYNPHLTRPELHLPSDGYQPPENSQIGVMGRLVVVRDPKRARPEVMLLSSDYALDAIRNGKCVSPSAAAVESATNREAGRETGGRTA